MNLLSAKERERLFIGAIGMVVLMKLVLMGLCSSDYQELMFVPFVNTFLSGHNPYSYFYENNLMLSFPYPPLMLLIESVFGWVSLQINSVFLSRLVFKIPLLIFDLVGFVFLRKMCSMRRKYLLVLYFCSPIILFSTYMHGQLDIIPTTFLVLSLYYMTRSIKKSDIHIAALFMGCALGTKLHILAVLPVVILYIAKKSGIKNVVLFLTEISVILSMTIMPFWGEGFIQTVLFNKEQASILDVILNYGSAQLLIVVLVECVLYLKTFELNNINRELLLSIVGVLFSVFLMCISPMPGWFVWIVPFVFIYFTSVYDNKYRMLAIYAGLNLVYLLYFLIFHHTGYVSLYVGQQSMEFLKVQSADLGNVVFSIMTAIQLVIIWNMYQYGVASNSLYKRSSTPFTIGISGDSGTGKSELLANLEDTLGAKKILHIEGDGDHRWERGSEGWEHYTHLDPKANYIYRQAEDISILRAGSKVCRVDYDHSTGTFTEQKVIKPKPYIILCGLHSLFLPKCREALDLKIYMDTDEELRRFWKIKRDISKRGYSVEKIVEQIEKRIPDAKKYIYPQKKYADFIISYFDPTLKTCLDVSHEVIVCMKISLNCMMNTEDIIDQLKKHAVEIRLDYSEDITRQILTIDTRKSNISASDFAAIAEMTVPNYKELFESNISWRDGLDGVLQLILLAAISDTMRGFS